MTYAGAADTDSCAAVPFTVIGMDCPVIETALTAAPDATGTVAVVIRSVAASDP